jgi:ureidoacrylate peracid hydrolase
MTENHKSVERIVKLVDAARAAGTLVVWFQAWHSELTDSDVRREEFLRAENPDRPTGCLEDSWDAEFYVVQPIAGEVRIKKHRFSGFIKTDLDLILRANGIKSLIMTGFGAGGCVENTARDGFMLDYYTTIVTDCTRSGNLESHQFAMDMMHDTIGEITTSDEIMKIWKEGKA